jgi:hypothetical protein
MSDDLQDLLSAWLGDEAMPARREALLQRLRSDAAFRKEFVEEIRLLGMLKAVQSTEPRWLRLEEVLGQVPPAADQPAGLDLDDRILQAVRSLPNHFARRFWKPALSTGLLTVLLVFLLLELMPFGRGGESAARRSRLAVAVKLDQVTWDAAQKAPPEPGEILGPVRLRWRSGVVSLAFLNGATVSVEGPADLELISLERVFCTRGKMLVYVLPQSAITAFTVLAPGAAVVDVGTEFGFNVQPGRPAQVLVLQGTVEASVLATNGTTLRSRLLADNAAAEILPAEDEIRLVTLRREDFIARPQLEMPRLNLEPHYIQAVRDARPWGYWRFASLAGGISSNEIPDRPPLLANGSLSLVGEPNGNHSVRFRPDDNRQSLQLAERWTPPARGGFAMEFLFAAEQYKDCSMAALVTDRDEHHMIVELTARGPHHLVHEPGTLRFACRQPPATTGGVNLFSSSVFFPCRWHHVVAQRDGSRIAFYIDGVLAGQAELDDSATIPPCHFLIGRLRLSPLPPSDTRTFAGQLAELALYDHPLTAAEIERHAQLALHPGQ